MMSNKSKGRKKKMNPMFLFLFIWLFVVAPSTFNVGDYRKALAEDVSSGKLKLTPEAKKYIIRGDEILAQAMKPHDIYITKDRIDNELYSAFVAKVAFERARLEMEIEK